jgi:hypothetical protein
MPDGHAYYLIATPDPGNDVRRLERDLHVPAALSSIQATNAVELFW